MHTLNISPSKIKHNISNRTKFGTLSLKKYHVAAVKSTVNLAASILKQLYSIS